MEAEDIERYLAELGTELTNRGLKKPVRVLLIGVHICSCLLMHPCSNRLYQNKYEMYKWIGEAIAKGMRDVHEIQRYARQKQISLYGACMHTSFGVPQK